jgi:hypothetical protein
MPRDIVPLTPEAREGLRTFTRDAIRKGAPQLVARQPRQQSLFPTAGLPLFTSPAAPRPSEEEPEG